MRPQKLSVHRYVVESGSNNEKRLLTEWGTPLQWFPTNCPTAGRQSLALNKDLGTVQLVPPAPIKSRPSQRLMLSYLGSEWRPNKIIFFSSIFKYLPIILLRAEQVFTSCPGSVSGNNSRLLFPELDLQENPHFSTFEQVFLLALPLCV